jgi:hypothetical protein
VVTVSDKFTGDAARISTFPIKEEGTEEISNWNASSPNKKGNIVTTIHRVKKSL